MTPSIVVQLGKIQTLWAQAHKEKKPGKPKTIAVIAKQIFDLESKLLNQLLKEGLASRFAHEVAKFKLRNTLDKLTEAIMRGEGPWDAIKKPKAPAPVPAKK